MTSIVGVKILALFFVVSLVKAESPELASSSLQKFVAASNEFALNLYQKITSDGPKNMFYSPSSISRILSMLLHGAEGKTQKELRRVLCLDKQGLSDEAVQRAFKNLIAQEQTRNLTGGYNESYADRILVEESVEIFPQYKEDIKRSYNAAIQSVDFKNKASEIKDDINNWIEEKTHGEIENFLDDVDPASVMILLNALYFKGLWKIPFNPNDTAKMTFNNHGGSSKDVDTMTVARKKYLISYTDDYEALRMPYGDNITDMLIVVPKEKDGLPELVKSLTPEKLNKIISDFEEMEITVYLPKFKFKYSENLSKHLIALGLQSLGDGALDLSGMTTIGKVPISQSMHKAVIEVTEEGTEASAATAFLDYINLNLEFTADKPFVFIIMDRKSRLILFMGQVAKL